MTPIDFNPGTLVVDGHIHQQVRSVVARGNLTKYIKWQLEKHLSRNIRRPLTDSLETSTRE